MVDSPALGVKVLKRPYAPYLMEWGDDPVALGYTEGCGKNMWACDVKEGVCGQKKLGAYFVRPQII